MALTENKLKQLGRKWHGQGITGTGRNSRDRGSVHFYSETWGKNVEQNRGAGQYGIRGLGMCGHPDTLWPITMILEETDEYIIACCDAGCATILAKKPPLRKKRADRRKSKLVKTLDGNLELEKKKTHEDNLFE